VLTGVLAGLLAQRVKPEIAAVLGVALHALAGELAAYAHTPYCCVASDLIEALPEVFSQLLFDTTV